MLCRQPEPARIFAAVEPRDRTGSFLVVEDALALAAGRARDRVCLGTEAVGRVWANQGRSHRRRCLDHGGQCRAAGDRASRYWRRLSRDAEAPARQLSGVARQAFKLRAELVERGFALTLDRGGMRQAWLRGRVKLQIRYLIQISGYNLGLIMRLLTGFGTSKRWANAKIGVIWLRFPIDEQTDVVLGGFLLVDGPCRGTVLGIEPVLITL